MKPKLYTVPILALVLSLTLIGSVLAQVPSTSDMGNIASSKAAAGNLLDINSATPDQLASLPGIGDKLSQKIVAGRPYSNKMDLVTKKVLPQSVFDKVKNLITTGPPK
jgi:competence protein ComEA